MSYKPFSPRISGAPTSLFALLCTSPGIAMSATEAAPSAAGSVMQMLFGLIVVIAALFGTLMLLKKLQAGRTHLVGNLKVIGATNVGPRERVVLVSIGSKVLVLGVTPGRVNALQTLESTEVPMSAPEPASGNDFALRLKQLLEKRRAQ
ncbi:flagellar biosynthetic protein FliO [Viridibacterium curvum]|uniref:Flagellar protein n=1 Tax=Viridibacterium curvum TaxID=1101404 RepID=A0ABP9QD42_9RHOO